MKTNIYAPFGIGFERLFNEAQLESTNLYPPHNVVKLTDDQYAIELAVAGFDDNELNIETIENILTVSGEKTSPAPDRDYIHKGISSRKFIRKFTLAEYVSVSGAALKNGILSINLEKVVPEEKRPRKIQIG